MSLTRSKVKVKITGLLNFRQLAKPYMLAAMTAAPLWGFLVNESALTANAVLFSVCLNYFHQLLGTRQS